MISILGSMATRGLIAELAASWDGAAEARAMGGVAAAQSIRDGVAIDVVVLAAPAMDKLLADGFLQPGSLAPVAISSMVAAIRTGDPVPALATADDVKRAILAADRIGYSTGPSGEHLLRLLDDWGIRDMLGDRLVQAPPGDPVGGLLAEGRVNLGFQQRSELMNFDGVTIAGPLPPPVAADTVFTAAITRHSAQPDQAGHLVRYLTSAETAEMKRRCGLQPP